jgi:exoribonuclease-2
LLNALVAFKGKPACIKSQNTHKFELEFADGSVRSVREKDFRLIHPEFTSVSTKCAVGAVELLQDFSEELLSLEEVTQWIFDDYTAQNAWCVALMVEDGLYFYWQKDKIFVRPIAQVQSIQSQRNEQALQLEQLERCIANIKQHTFDEQDLPYIKTIEKVALNQSKHAKILTHLKVENTPEAAHKLLLKIKYWQQNFNPYPQQFGIEKDETMPVEMCNKTRKDLTHLRSLAIDNTGSTDADDAISLEGDKIWVHIADVASCVVSDSSLDIYARSRASNLYLPEQVIHMLPTDLTQVCALGLQTTSPALSIGFALDSGALVDIQILHSIIKVENISYQQADDALSTDTYLQQLQALANIHQAEREAKDAISLNLPNVEVRFKDEQVQIKAQESSPSRDLVAEMMIMAGHAAAQFAKQNEIAMPYAIQDAGDFPPETLDNKNHLTLAQSFKATKFFKRSATSTKPLLHYGLGLTPYLRITSPLRRYFDLLAHQQLVAFIANEQPLSQSKVKEIIGITNASMPSVGKTTRASNEHYKCLYLIQNPKWKGRGVVVDVRKNKALLLIGELGMMTQIKFKTPPELDESISLKVSSVDLVTRLVEFKQT